MNDQTENLEPEPVPDENLKKPEIPGLPTGLVPEEEQAPPEMNEIFELRQKLMYEEPDSEPRKALIHRMTGTLSSRRSQERAKEKSPTGSNFGVRTAGLDESSGGEVAQEAGNDEKRKEIDAEKRASQGLAWRKNRLNGEESQTEDDEVQPFEDHTQTRSLPPSKVAPPPQHSDPNDSMLEDGQSYFLGVYNPDSETAPAESKVKVESAPVQEESKSSSQYRKQQLNRYIGYNPKRSLWTRFRELSVFDKLLYIALFVAVFGLIVLLGFLYAGRITGNQPIISAATPTLPAATSSVVLSPNPALLHLPGGWTFPLSIGSMVEGKWQPKTAEWLQGTEVRRVVAIPWNKQVEAVVRTFGQKDKIELEMTNKDVLEYYVDSVTQVSAQDSSVLYDTTPSLVIILTGSNETTRWVVIARP